MGGHLSLGRQSIVAPSICHLRLNCAARSNDDMGDRFMPRKIVLTTVLIVGSITAAAALPCNLTEQDYQSLANGSLHLSKADANNLSAKDQENLCKARKFYHEARGVDPETFGKNHSIKDVATGMSRFVTEAEYDEVRGALAEVMANAAAGRMR